jgi:hypothetical protein
MITTTPDRYGGGRRCAPHRIAHRAGAILFNSDGTFDDEVVRRRAGGHLSGNTDLHQIEAFFGLDCAGPRSLRPKVWAPTIRPGYVRCVSVLIIDKLNYELAGETTPAVHF